MSRVIKIGEQSPKLLKRLEAISIADHVGEARLVVERSREQAREILREAQIAAARRNEEAGERGYQAGFRRGYEAGAQAGYQAAMEEAAGRFRAEQASLVDALRGVLDAFESRKRELELAGRQDVVEFAVRLAEKVTRQVGVIRREAATANLEAALRLVGRGTDLVVTVNPADRATLERFAAEFAKTAGGAAYWSLATDEAVAPGGCRLTTATSEVDATLDTQIGQIVGLLTGGTESGS